MHITERIDCFKSAIDSLRELIKVCEVINASDLGQMNSILTEGIERAKEAELYASQAFNGEE